MDLKQVNEAFDYRLIGGSQYQWNCYGSYARYLDFESDYGYGSVIFDTVNQTVYSAEVYPIESGGNHVKPYRWLNPLFKDKLFAESKEREVDPNLAWDDTKWVDLETEEDFLEKANAIIRGEPFDDRVEIPLDLDDKTLLKLAMEAHKRDITLNQYVEELLLFVIEKLEKEKGEKDEGSIGG